jgi:hypothetical protein
MAFKDISNPPNDTSIRELISWGHQYQVYVNPDIEIYGDPITGLSFRAKQDLPPSSKVVACPYQISLSYLNAIEAPGYLRHSSPFPEPFLSILSEDDPNIIGHFFLIQQYLLKNQSFWCPYTRLLPQPHEPEKLGIPIWWPEEDQKFLDGTNAEPPIKTRKALWVDEWERAISILREDSHGWEEYSYELYQWAATIFGTRSFRASMTIPEEMLQEQSFAGHSVWDHVKADRFSFLLPILDIGNHNGINNVDWRPDPKAGLSLSTRDVILQGSQVFNFYGNKSNSELLVGYGFILPEIPLIEFDNDVVNLKLKPGPDALALRRTQQCHIIPAVPDEESIFAVRMQHGVPALEHCFGVLPHDLIDLVICMVANKRDKRYLSLNPKHCLGK